jgi:hypothetical protein
VPSPSESQGSLSRASRGQPSLRGSTAGATSCGSLETSSRGDPLPRMPSRRWSRSASSPRSSASRAAARTSRARSPAAAGVRREARRRPAQQGSEDQQLQQLCETHDHALDATRPCAAKAEGLRNRPAAPPLQKERPL